MSGGDELSLLRGRLAALEEDNGRLRTALAEAEARAANGGHTLLLRDGLPAGDAPLVCLHAAVRGRVSVVIPAFDAEAFLERAVRSVWDQTWAADAVEILVVDDGSRDGTRELACLLARQSRMRMSVLTHDGNCNRGVAPSRQLGVRHATGELIALLDADDVFLPDRLQASIDALRTHGDAVAVCSLGRNVDAAGGTVVGHNGTTRAGEWRAAPGGIEPPFTFEQLWMVDPIANSSLTIRRSALETVGGFPALMAHQAEDWLLVLKLSLLAPIPCVERELFLYTHHAGAYTHAYHGHGWQEGARMETFYHLAWWMLRSPSHAAAGARFFRRVYPGLIADHQRFLPLLRTYYEDGGRPAAGPAAFDEHVRQLRDELSSLRRVVHVKLHENKRLRRALSAGASRTPLEAVHRD